MELPSAKWRIAGTVLLAGFAAIQIPLIRIVRDNCSPYWTPSLDPGHAFFLIESFVLVICIGQMRSFGPGNPEHWRKFALPVAIVFAIPPLMVIAIYATMTDKPYSGMTWSGWLIESAAQEFFFTGFIYGALSRLHGEPGNDTRSAMHPVILLSALSFMLWHWPNLYVLSPRYAIFQAIYTCLGGCWAIQMRRLTGSLWPGVANHILVNWLAATI